MAQGRFISKSIATNEEVAGVSFEADYLFGRMIPHLDAEGRMSGNPVLIKADVCPLRPEITVEVIPELLEELARSTDIEGRPLIRWYEVQGKRVVSFPGFEDQQVGLRKDREAASKMPAPDHPEAVAVIEDLRDSGSTPDLLRSDAGATPAEEEVEVEGEVEGEVSSSIARESDDPTPEERFEALLPDHPPAVEVLAAMKHPAGPAATAATLRTAFLYDDPAEAMPDPSVQGRDPPERQDLVARALVEMASTTAEVKWAPRQLAGFIRRLSNGADDVRSSNGRSSGSDREVGAKKGRSGSGPRIRGERLAG